MFLNRCYLAFRAVRRQRSRNRSSRAICSHPGCHGCAPPQARSREDVPSLDAGSRGRHPIDAKYLGDSRGLRRIRIERQQHDKPVCPFGEPAQAGGHARRIECGNRWRPGLYSRFHESRSERFPPLRNPAFGLSHHPAGPQNERSDLLRAAHLTSVQPLDRQQQNLLGEVVGRRLAVQVPTAVSPREARSNGASRSPRRDQVDPGGPPAMRRASASSLTAPSGRAACPASAGTVYRQGAVRQPAPHQAGVAARRRRSAGAAAPSPTNVDPCMAASTRGCRSASSVSRRRVSGVSGS